MTGVAVVRVEPSGTEVSKIDAALHNHWPNAKLMAEGVRRAMLSARNVPLEDAVFAVVRAATQVMDDECDSVIHPMCWANLREAIHRLRTFPEAQSILGEK